MRKLTILILVTCIIVIASKADAWDMRWMNAPEAPFSWPGEDGLCGTTDDEMIPTGAIVQLIADGGNYEIDDPMEAIRNGEISLADWLAGGSQPVGDDFLVPSTGAPNPQYAYMPGYFVAVYIQSDLPPGSRMYTRAFSAAEPDIGDWYASTEFYDPPDLPFPDYTIRDPMCLGIQIPEPSVTLLGVVGLLLAVVKWCRK